MFICSVGTFGQLDKGGAGRFIVRLAPLSLLDSYNGPSYKLGIEFQTDLRWAFTTDFGGYFRNFNWFRNYSGFNFDFGIRHYLKNENSRKKYYLSLNTFYKEQGFDYSDSFQSVITYHTNYHTQKYVSCINLNFGKILSFKNRLEVDLFAGVGIRFKKVNSSLSLDELETGIEYSDSQSLYFLVTPGKFIYPNINLGLRCGFRVF